MSDDTQIAKMGQSLPKINQPQQPIQANLNQYGNESTQIAYVQHYDATTNQTVLIMQGTQPASGTVITPEDRTAITKMYADFSENEYCKIYPNQEFIYREYVVMQPLQRSYAITAERIEAMLSKGSLSSLYDQAKVDELENAEELTGKERKKLEAYQNNQPVYETIVATLSDAISAQVYLSPAAFMPVLAKVLANVTADKKLLEKIADGLSTMDI